MVWKVFATSFGMQHLDRIRNLMLRNRTGNLPFGVSTIVFPGMMLQAKWQVSEQPSSNGMIQTGDDENGIGSEKRDAAAAVPRSWGSVPLGGDGRKVPQNLARLQLCTRAHGRK